MQDSVLSPEDTEFNNVNNYVYLIFNIHIVLNLMAFMI